MTPEYIAEELRKMAWSKDQWLDTHAKKMPGSVETKRRERDVLAAAARHYETLCASNRS